MDMGYGMPPDSRTQTPSELYDNIGLTHSTSQCLFVKLIANPLDKKLLVLVEIEIALPCI
jgi:hypothetical protein